MNRFLQKLDTAGLLLLVAAAIYYSVTNLWDKWVIGLGIAGILLVVTGMVANYRQILLTLGKRSTKYASNYVISVVLVVGIVSGLNFMGQRHPKRYDLTAIGRFTLAPQTVQVLDKLSADMDIKAFFPGGDYPPLKELLIEYRTRSRHVQYEFIDPDKQPDVAKMNEVTTYGTFSNPFTGSTLKFGTVIVTSGQRREKIEKRSEEVREEDLTNAIIKVLRTEMKKVYFVEGHGEKSPEDTERTGYSAAKKALEEQGFRVETANLATQGRVPADAKVAILAGPQTEPFEQETKFLDDFLAIGGGLFLMLDPEPSAAMTSFLKSWGITPDNDVVLDVSGAGRLIGAGPSIPLVRSYDSHRIVERFKLMTFFPFARSIKPSTESVIGVTVETLFRTNENSWGETDLKRAEAEFDEQVDLKGPLSLAVAATKEIKAAEEGSPAVRARMVVVGDSDFAVNSYFEAQGNGNLFLNMVSWLAQDEDLISIRPKPPQDRRMILSQSQQRMLLYLIVFILPASVLITGITVWNRRRR